MTDGETKLVKKQLDEAYKFQDNTLIPWVHHLAGGLVDNVKDTLNGNPDDDDLDLYEGNIQDTCDIFAGLFKKNYKHEEYYDFVLAKNDEHQEPFNHVWNIHRLMDLIEGEITSNYMKLKQD